MKQDQAVVTILQRWMNQWPGLSSNVPFVFDNDVIDESSTYARVSIDFMDEEQQTFGNPGARKFLESGLINVKLLGPGDAGRNPLDLLCEYVRQIFQTVRFGAAGAEEGIRTFATSVDALRPQSDRQFWVLLARTPFEFFDVR